MKRLPGGRHRLSTGLDAESAPVRKAGATAALGNPEQFSDAGTQAWRLGKNSAGCGGAAG